MDLLGGGRSSERAAGSGRSRGRRGTTWARITDKYVITGGGRDPYAAGPQPGDRRPAPGELALLQAFLNTHFDLASGGGESLDSPEALRAWLGERGLLRDAALAPPDVARAVSIREGLRALALANNDEALDARAVDAMRAASRGAAAEIRAEPDGAHFVCPSAATSTRRSARCSRSPRGR